MTTPSRADLMRIAAESGCDVRTILAHLAGQAVRPANAKAIDAAIERLGIVRGEAGGSGPTTKRGE